MNYSDKMKQCGEKLKAKYGDKSNQICELAFKKSNSPTDKEFEEAASSLSNAALLRSGAKEHSVKLSEKNFVPFRESSKDSNGNKKFSVIIIKQGLGNLRDKNYYSSQAIESGVSVYEGKKCYYDHPTPTEEKEQPGRSVKDIVGHFENVKAVKSKDGLMELQADFIPIQGESRLSAIEMFEHAVSYSKKYPDKNFIGLSINGDGEGMTLSYEDFLSQVKPTDSELEKIKEIKGQEINLITRLLDAVSADVVTEPGAGGGIKVKEYNFKQRRNKMLTALKKLFAGVESKDQAAVDEAAKEIMRGESEASAAAAPNMEAVVKNMKQLKQEMKQEEGETEEAYEVKVLKAAMDRASKKEGEADDKDSDDKKQADPKMDGDKDKNKEGDLEKENAELKAQMEAMKKEMDELKKASEAKEAEAKEAMESAAKAKTELAVKVKESMIETKLSKSGLPRSITGEWKSLLEKCRTEKEIDETITTMKETAEKAIEAEFISLSPMGLVERRASATIQNNDDLFK